jgi:hypothetical protein
VPTAADTDLVALLVFLLDRVRVEELRVLERAAARRADREHVRRVPARACEQVDLAEDDTGVVATVVAAE